MFENHNKESHVIGHQDVTYRRLYLFHLLVALASVHDDIACISSNKRVSPYLLHNTSIPSILFPRYIYLLSNYSHMNPQETYHSIIHTIWEDTIRAREMLPPSLKMKDLFWLPHSTDTFLMDFMQCLWFFFPIPQYRAKQPKSHIKVSLGLFE